MNRRLRNWSCVACIALAGLATGGCSRAPSNPTPAERVEPVTLTKVDKAAVDETVWRHRGSVVLVDFWATWCAPCVQLFPHTVELQRRLADRGLTVVTVSLDPPDAEAAVRKFLAGQKAVGLENLIANNGGSAQAFQEYGIYDGSLPHLKVYDRNGKLRKEIAGTDAKAIAKKIDGIVEQLLDEK